MGRASTATAIILFLAITSRGFADPEIWLDYTPHEVELSGKVVEMSEYGPPSYGEHPETDDKLTIQILRLSTPINVKADPEDDINVEAQGIREVQLAFTSSIKHSQLDGRNVIVRGTLYHAYSGYHFRDILIYVQELKIADPLPNQDSRIVHPPLAATRREISVWSAKESH